MIKYLKVTGFKCFKEINENLRKLTVLTGINNSGKSSFIQAIRMAAYFNNSNGPYIEGLGGYSELRSKYAGSLQNINITLALHGEKIIKLDLADQGHSFLADEGCLMPFTEFIAADRYGPRIQQPILQEEDCRLTVGSFGQFSAYYAYMLESILVSDNLRHIDSVGNTLKHQLKWWMGEISPGIKLDFTFRRQLDLASMSVDDLRSTNSGFGISYALPIVLCLLAMSGSIGEDDSDIRVKKWFDKIKNNSGLLLIENPEAHLHPGGQTNIGRLIAMAASSGLQIVIETHSDHVLDGIRLAVKNEIGVNSNDILIKYFEKQSSEELKITNINIKDDGKLDFWPKGFFDQNSKNLRELSRSLKKVGEN